MRATLLRRPATGLTRRLATLAVPLVLQQLSYTLLGVADTYFVSMVSTEALAAVGLAGVMFFALLMLFRSTATSSVVFVGRAHGAGDETGVGLWVWRCLTMAGLLSLVSLALPWLFAWLFGLAAPQGAVEVRELGVRYLQIRAFEVPFAVFSAVVWGFLVGRGDARTPMLIAWLSVLANIALDWVFVLGNLGAPALGVAGAAYATVAAGAIGALVSALVLWSPANRRRFGTGRVAIARGRDLLQVLRIGLPLGLGDFIEIASFSAFFAIIGRIGTEALAANQIALQYMSLSFTVGVAFSMATSSQVAQQLGAARPDLAEGVGYRGAVLGMLAMGLIGLGYLIAPEALMRPFTSDPEVIGAGAVILRLVAFYQVFDGLAIVLSGALNGAGDTTFTMLVKSVLAWGLFIPLVALLVFGLDGGLREAWIGALAYLLLLGMVYLVRFRSGRWKAIRLA